MPFLLILNWLNGQEWVGQIFWTLAIVFTLLLLIRLGLSLYVEEDAEVKAERQRLDARSILLFLTFFSWTNVWANYLDAPPLRGLIFGSLFGLIAALLSRFFTSIFPRPAVISTRHLDADKVLSSTGQVLQPIPPHRNGFGKVHLNLRGAPYSIDAVTAGKELAAGSAVRVVDVLDEQIVLVEPVEQAHPRPPQSKPAAPNGRG